MNTIFIINNLMNYEIFYIINNFNNIKKLFFNKSHIYVIIS